MDKQQDTSIKIEIAAHGADEVKAQYATMADTLARISSAEGDAAAKAALFAAEAKKAEERITKLGAQVENWRGKLDSGGKSSAIATQKIATLEAQIGELSAGMQQAQAEAAKWQVQADRAATGQAALAAASAEVASATDEAAEAQTRVTVAEAKAAQVAAQAAGARVEHGRVAARMDEERADVLRQLAEARKAEDDAAIEEAQARLRALDAVQKAALSGLRPYERTAFLLEQVKQRYKGVVGATDSYAAAVGNLSRRLDDQTRRSLENRDRSISALLDQVKDAVQAEHRSVRALQGVAGAAVDTLTSLVPGLGAVRAGIAGVQQSSEAWGTAAAAARARQIELADSLRVQQVELEDLRAGIRRQREALEGMGADTDEARHALEQLGQAEAQVADRADAVARAQREVAESIEKTSRQSERGAASIGAMVGVFGALLAGATAAAGALVSVGNASADMGAQVQQAASRAGVAVTEMSRFRTLLERMGGGGVEVEMRDLAEAIAEVGVKLNDAADPASEQARLFQALGLEVSSLRGLKPEQLFERTVEALARMEDSTSRTDAAMRLFGDDLGLRLLPVVREGQGAIQRYKQANDELGLTLSRDGVQANLAYAQTVRGLRLEWQRVTEAVGQPVTSALTRLGQNVRRDLAEWGASLEAAKALAGGASYNEAVQMAERSMKAWQQQQQAVQAATAAEAQALDVRRESRHEAEAYAAILRGEVEKAWAAAEAAVEREMAAEEKASEARKRAEEKRVAARAAALELVAELEREALTGEQRAAAEAAAARAKAEQQIGEAVKARALTAVEAERALAAVVAAEAAKAAAREEERNKEKYRVFEETQRKLLSITEGAALREQTLLERIAAEERAALAEIAELYAKAPELAVEFEDAEARVRETAAARRRNAAVTAEREFQAAVESVAKEGMTTRQRAELEHAASLERIRAELGQAYEVALRSMEQAGMASDQRRMQLKEAYERTLTEATRQGAEQREQLVAQEAAQARQAWQQVITSVLSAIGQAAGSVLAEVSRSAEAAAKTVADVEQKRAAATTEAERQVYEKQLELASERLDRHRADALKLFRIQQALQAAQAGMAAALAVIQSLAAPGGASNPLNVAAAVAAGVAGAAAVTQVAMQQPPKFHVGGEIGTDTRSRALKGGRGAGDEHTIVARAGERVLTPAQQRALDVRLSSRVEVTVGRRGVAAVTAEQRKLR